MAVAHREMTIAQLTAVVGGLQTTVSNMQFELSKLQHIAGTTSMCIKALWMVLAPLAVNLIIQWIKNGKVG